MSNEYEALRRAVRAYQEADERQAMQAEADAEELRGKILDGETTPTNVQARLIERALQGKASKRDIAMFGFSAETIRAVVRTIEVSPVLEEAILHIADLAYADGQESVE